MVYLDHAATTKPYKSVIEIANKCMTDCWGNPGSTHVIGRKAYKELSESRESVSAFINAKTDNVIFTSSGSESNNYVIRNEFERASRLGTCIIISAGEHDSIYNSATTFSHLSGVVCHIAPLNIDGTVNMEKLTELIETKRPSFVSVIHTSNEFGSINPVKEIAKLCHDNDARFHTDCVQAAGFSKLDVKDIGCDYLTFSSHKIHGIKGAAALYVRNLNYINDKLIIGGENQEFGYRGGTQNIVSIAAFGEACRITKGGMRKSVKNVQNLKQKFWDNISLDKDLFNINCIPILNSPSIDNTGKTINIMLPRVDAKTLIMLLEQMDVYVSGGSACKSLVQKPNRVLIASGMSEDSARSSFRISFDGTEENGNSEEDMRYTALCIKQAVKALNNMNN